MSRLKREIPTDGQMTRIADICPERIVGYVEDRGWVASIWQAATGDSGFKLFGRPEPSEALTQLIVPRNRGYDDFGWRMAETVIRLAQFGGTTIDAVLNDIQHYGAMRTDIEFRNYGSVRIPTVAVAPDGTRYDFVAWFDIAATEFSCAEPGTDNQLVAGTMHELAITYIAAVGQQLWYQARGLYHHGSPKTPVPFEPMIKVITFSNDDAIILIPVAMASVGDRRYSMEGIELDPDGRPMWDRVVFDIESDRCMVYDPADAPDEILVQYTDETWDQVIQYIQDAVASICHLTSASAICFGASDS